MGFATRHQPRQWSSTSKIVGPGITIFQGPNSYEPKLKYLTPLPCSLNMNSQRLKDIEEEVEPLSKVGVQVIGIVFLVASIQRRSES